MKSSVKTHTPYFYAAFAVIALAVLACIYEVANFKGTIQAYVNQGYELEYVMENMPYTQLIPSFLDILRDYGLLCAVLFGVNSIVKRLGGTKEEAGAKEEPAVQTIAETESEPAAEIEADGGEQLAFSEATEENTEAVLNDIPVEEAKLDEAAKEIVF